MKKLIEIDESEGLEKLMGKRVTLLCSNYFYTGKLLGVNTDSVLLNDPSIVYETGDWGEDGWKDAQKMPNDDLYVRVSHIEAYGVMK